MKIDWLKGTWRVWDMQGNLLASAPHVVCHKPVELVNTDNGNHGWAVTSGTLERVGETLFIR